MPHPRIAAFAANCTLLLALCACGAKKDSAPSPTESASSAQDAAAANSFPASLRVVGNGYPVGGAPCRQLGESDATADLLDDSADLVGCPTKDNARELNGKIVGVVDGITLVSVPRSASQSGTAPSGLTSPVKSAADTAARDPIRGKGGLEEKCLARVAKEVGAPVIGTNRIEESQAAVEIYVNVRGANAPWKCHGYKDGTIDEVTFTGSEGAA